MLVLSSKNGKIGIPAAMEILKCGGSVLDAVEVGTRIVERNADDHTVGLGGLPNAAGEVRLDASIMDGRTLRAGAVGSVGGIVHAITLARKVMEETPHVFLVGEGAERFAREMGMKADDPLTAEAENKWRCGLQQHYPNLDLSNLDEVEDLITVIKKLNAPMTGWVPEDKHGTVNFIAMDSQGNFATAVSTSGWPWCYPGRLGDSPVIGGGGYADNRWGAAASTGTGEVVLRTSATRSIVLYMKMGMSVSEATLEALNDLSDLNDPYTDHIAIIAVDRSGNCVGYTHRSNETYAFMTDGMEEVEEVEMGEITSSNQ